MADFARFCPVCYAYFNDPDLYAKHVATCGKIQQTEESESVKEPAVDSEDVPAEKPKTKSKK